MKAVIVCAAILLSSAVSGFAADERTPPASTGVAAKASTETAPAPAPDAPALAVAANIPASAVLPAAPSAIIAIKPARTESHRFFDVRNSLALGAVAASLTADALSTQKGLSYPGFYEINPLARPFVQSKAGAAVYSAGSLGLVAAGMYVAHRTHHHKLERILPFAIAGWEGMLSARNYHVIAANTK